MEDAQQETHSARWAVDPWVAKASTPPGKGLHGRLTSEAYAAFHHAGAAEVQRCTFVFLSLEKTCAVSV